MSDCRNGGRLFYARPTVIEYAQEEPIRFVVAFTDGTLQRFSVERRGREVDFVTVDHEVLRPLDPDEKWDVEDGRIVSVTLGSTRFEKVRECTLTRTHEGYPCNDYECSACGKTYCAERANEHCSRCGARVTRVVDPNGRELTLNEAATCIEARDV